MSEVTVSYPELNEIKIYNIVKRTLQDFTDVFIGPEEQRPFWCNGVLFKFFEFPDVEYLVTERIEHGRVHLLQIDYHLIDKKPNVLRNGGIELGVIDMSGSEFWDLVTQYVKQRDERMKK